MNKIYYVNSGTHLYEQSEIIAHFGLDNYIRLGAGVATAIYKKRLAAMAVVHNELGFSEN